MVHEVRARIRERVLAGATLEELEYLILQSRGLTQEERDALWVYAWHCEPKESDDPYHAAAQPECIPEPALRPLS